MTAKGNINHPNGTAHPSFIVVGAGYAGLTVAIELVRNGFSVLVIESAKDLTTQGDVIQLGSSASRIFSKWGNVISTVHSQAAIPSQMIIHDSKGEVLLKSPLPEHFGGFPVLYCQRGFAQKTIYEYAVSLGVKFRFGSRVMAYFEEGEQAGVCVGDERLYADGVIGADGIHSTARRYITGKEDKASTSGFANYRSWFPLDCLKGDPRTEHWTRVDRDVFNLWVGKETHAVFIINKALRGVCVFCIHKDDANIEESWSFPGKLSELLEVVDGWDDNLRAIFSKIPANVLIDWKLLWRDPVQKWVSDKGRVVIIGDAAHPHLPTSGTGGTQAVEDGATVATLIAQLGIEKTPLAFRAFEKLRYERTALTQRMGWETRHRWHQTDWEMAKKDPQYLKVPQPDWLYGHDAVQYTVDKLEEAVKSVESGTPLVSTNVPKGHVHEEWTIEMMCALESQQAPENFYKVQNR